MCASVFVLRQVAVHYWKTVINNAITAGDATTHIFSLWLRSRYRNLLTQILFRYLSSALELRFNIIIIIDVFIWGCNNLLSTGKYAEYVLYVLYAHMSQKVTWGKSRSEKQEILKTNMWLYTINTIYYIYTIYTSVKLPVQYAHPKI